jgi:hypothetical protein
MTRDTCRGRAAGTSTTDDLLTIDRLVKEHEPEDPVEDGTGTGTGTDELLGLPLDGTDAGGLEGAPTELEPDGDAGGVEGFPPELDAAN